MRPIDLQFFARETIEVARDLLGQVLVRQLPDGQRVSGRIVETEAYLGAEDPACHSFGHRRTKRTESMYWSGGHSYVYLIYGIYHCFNIVSMGAGEPEAVLIRALEPLEGIDWMRVQRPKAKSLRDLARGPGRLCEALKIDRSLSGHPLDRAPLWLEKGSLDLSSEQIVSSPRIGVDYAGDAAYWPLRFSLKANPFVSLPPKEEEG